MALHLAYRPQNFDELFGNDSIKTSLKSVLSREDRPHAFLLTGPSGMGKTTIGRIIKEELNCYDEDFYEINSSNNRGIDTIRDIAQAVNYSPIIGKCKVYLCDEVHGWTRPAMEAMLKLLEDCPSHVYFILCTTDPDKLLKTILTRCTTYQVKPLSDKEMMGLLNWVLECEGKKISTAVRNEIIRVSEGCPRQALVVLDQVIDLADDEALAAVEAVTVGEAEVVDICRHLIAHKNWDGIRGKVKLVLNSTDPEKLRYAVLGYMNAVLLNSKTHDRASEIIDIFSENTYASGKAGVCNMIYLACK